MSEAIQKKKNIVWISRSTGPNKNHRNYIEKSGSDLQFLDWNDNAPAPLRYLEWFYKTIFFKNRRKYDIIISIDVKFPVAGLKFLRLLRKDQKIICFDATETLYFLHSGFYKGKTALAFKKALEIYDGHICVSKMQEDLLKLLIGEKAKNVHTIFNGIEDEEYARLLAVKPDLESKNIVFIGNLYASWRLWYKGIDLLLGAFKLLSQQHKDATLTIVGEVEARARQEIEKAIPIELKEKIIFHGKEADLTIPFSKGAVYLHPSRGEAYGISIIEAMAAGLPSFVSNWTGAKEVVEIVDKQMVFDLNDSESGIANKINAYFNLSLGEKIKLSQRVKQATASYIRSNSVKRLNDVLSQI